MFKVAREFSKNFMVTFAKIRQKSRQFNSFFFCFFSKPDKVNSDQGVGKLKSILAGCPGPYILHFSGAPSRTLSLSSDRVKYSGSSPVHHLYCWSFTRRFTSKRFTSNSNKHFCRCFKSVFRKFLVVRRQGRKMMLMRVFTWRMVFTRMFTAAATNPSPMRTGKSLTFVWSHI